MTPCLWFDNQAEDAMYFYTSISKNSKIGDISRYGEGGPGEPLKMGKLEIAGLRRAFEAG